METSYAKNPRKILGYLMAFAMVFFSTSSFAQATYTLNMTDAFGDGWNGNVWNMYDNTGAVVATGTLNTGSAGSTSFSLADGCYTYDCGGGSWQSEVGWSLEGPSGVVLLTGGAPASGNVDLGGVGCTYGCTDPLANNYDPTADFDDGSCNYAPCAATAPYHQDFNTGLLPVGVCVPNQWAVSATSGDGWRFTGNPGYAAGSNGRSAGTYAWIDFSGTDAGALLEVENVDMSGLSSPTLAFDYFSDLGTYALTGSPNILYVEYLDAGGAWTTFTSLQTDTAGWNTYIFALTATEAAAAEWRFRGESGGASNDFYNDLLLDDVKFMEAPILGCTDPFADNYNASANIDDGSCLYTGCTDPMATNYCASCNVPDSSLCVYPACNALDFCEDFESFNLSTNGWITANGSQSGVALVTTGALYDTVSIEMTGGTVSWGATPTTEAAAFAYTDYVASATICLDLSASTGTVNLTYDAELLSLFSAAYSWHRVQVNGVVQNDINGNTSFNNTNFSTGQITYDLSPFAGQSSVYVTFESSCKYGPSAGYTSWNTVRLDNICAFNVNPCTYYGIAADYAFDASCNGGSDGQASATVQNSNGGGDSYSWTDAAGNVVGTTAAITGLSAGTYTCIVSDATNGCSASTSVTIGEPTAITANGIIVDATSPMNTDGSVDLSVSGGTPCYTGANDTLSTYDGGTEYVWSGAATGMTHYFDITAANACGITGFAIKGVYAVAGNIEIWTRNGTANGFTTSDSSWTLNTSIPNSATANGQTVYVPLLSAVGMESGDVIGFAIHTPGDAYLTLGGFDAFSTTLASDANISVSTGLLDANGPTFGGSATYGGVASSANFDGFVYYAAPSYNYAWSTGATTEDVSGLGMGPIAVTVTDCNGCVGTWSGFVAANVVYGCTDPNASNYDPSANTDDGSCTYPGCTDSLAQNYDPAANLDDGSCTYSCQYNGYDDAVTIHAFIDLSAAEGSWELLDSNGDTVGFAAAGSMTTSALYLTELCVDNGCYILNFYDSWGDGWVDWNGTQGYIAAIASNGDTLSYDLVTGLGGTAVVSVGGATCVFGCTDSTAVNYDPSAGYDDGSCVYCNDEFLTLNMYDSFGDGWNGNTFTMTDSYGVQQAYATLATGSVGTENLCIPADCYTISCDGGSWQAEVSWELVDASGTIVQSGGAPYNGAICLPAVAGCMDSTACNYDPLANTDNGSCNFDCYGCTDPAALNYDSTSTIDDGSCIYCSLTASTTSVDATSTTANDGAVDLTVNGTYCVTTTDLFVSVAGGNGQSGNAFNLINTSGSDLYIDGFSQGPASGNASFTGATMEVFCSYGDYTSGTPTWTSVATATVDLTTGQTTGYIQIPGGVTIPAGGTYGFWVGCSNTTVQYTNGTGTVGVTPWASDANVTITEGHGGTFPTGLNFSPRNWNGTVHYGDPNATVYSFAWSTGDTTEDLTNVGPGVYTVTVTDCQGCQVSASATVIVNIVYGCTDPTAYNYNPAANTDDGSCIAVALGCTDTTAANYDPAANTDDGSCHYCFGGYSVNIDCGGGSFTSEVSWALNNDSGVTVLTGGAPFNLDTCLDGGCYTLVMNDSWGDGWNGNTFTLTENVSGASVSATLASGSNGTASLSMAEIGCFTYGCTDPLALNYDPLANTDDGSCNYAACVTSLPFNEDFETGTADVTLLAGSAAISTIDSNNNVTSTNTYTWHGQGNTPAWGATPTSGANAFSTKPNNIATMNLCVDLTAYAGQPVNVSFDLRQEYSFNANYSWFRLADDTGAVLVDGNGTDYFQPATNCGDAWANVSYDLSAYAGSIVNLQFQSCNKYYDDYYQCGDNAYVDNIVIDVQATPVYGCTDPTASNYDPAANTDDGSCCYGNWAVLEMFDSFGDGWNGNSFVMTDALTGTVVFNSTLAGGSSGTDNGCVPDGCYDIVVGGGSWQGEVSWNLIAGNDTTSGGAPYTNQITVGAGSCAIGCTDSTAVNYDPSAQVDDGSCVYPCLDNSVYITVNTDYYGTECSWDITDNAGTVVASGGPYSLGYNTVNDSSCLVDGCYTLTMYDSFGDGWTTGTLGSVDVTDGMGGTYASGQLLTGFSASFDFTIGTTLGCTDTAATNYDACANTDDGSCIYPCAGNDVTIVVGGGSYGSEVGWSLVDGSGTVVASATAPAGTGTWTACLADDCYTMNMTDTWGDGWNGNTYTITDNNTGTVYGTGTLASGSAGSESVSIGAACPVYGCTDSTALNYDPLADTDDGSCIYPAPCNADNFCDDFESGDHATGNWIVTTGTEAEAYVASAGTNLSNGGSFSALFAGGNYVGWTGGSSTTTSAQAWANTDHISQIEMCLDLSAVSGGPLNMVLDYNSSTYFGAGSGNYSWFRVLVDGVVLADNNGNLDHYAPGELSLTYDLSSYAGTNPTVTLQASCKYGSTYAGGAYSDIVYIDNLCIISAVPGCTDSTASNYDPAATQDDGSCLYPCTDNEVAVNMYDSWGDGWNGNTYNITDGSGGSWTGGLLSGSYGSDTLCLPTGCYDITVGGGSYPSEVSFDFGSLVGAPTGTYTDISIGGAVCGIPGCTDALACNYDSTATVDDGSCSYQSGSSVDLIANSPNDWYADWDNDGIYESYAQGYTYFIDLYSDGTGLFQGTFAVTSWCLCNDVFNMDYNGYQYTGSVDASGNVVGTSNGNGGFLIGSLTLGCTDATASNYDPAANGDDGSCTYCTYGCTDAAACNYDSTATCDDGSCLTAYGCTDSTATNFDPLATCDDGSCTYCVYGCTDPAADNYYAGATCDDGSCTYGNTCGLPTGLGVTDLIHDRATLVWNSTNSSTCNVDQIRLKYREVGTTTWSQKNMGAPAGSPAGPSCNISNSDKLVLNLTPSTNYEWYMKVWYCNAATTGWSAMQYFTTADPCPNVISFAVTTPTTTKATFTWDTAGVYNFVRIRIKVDSVGGGFTTAGGFGVPYGTLTKNKNGLTPGQAYKGWARTWCDPAGGPYRAATWNGPLTWTMPTSIRLEGGTSIANLDVYPNPSRDVFNVAFTSDEVQDLEVRIVNIVGEVVYTEDLQKFVGEYTKALDLGSYTKGVYFLEITTNNGVVNKKLILQ